MNQTPSSNDLPRWPLFLVALIALLPFVLNYGSFKALFYFEDEWDLLDMWAKVGFIQWTSAVFAENFMPLFKSIWGGAILLSSGSYISILTLVWLNHAVNAALVARIVQRLGCGTWLAMLAAVCFGISPLHYETLGWSLQWSAVMSLTFFLGALMILVPVTSAEPAPSWRSIVLAALCALASPLCFTRGVLAGPVLAAVVLSLSGRQSWIQRSLKALVLVLPSFAVALLVARNSSGNHQHLHGVWGQITTFAVHFFGESPLRTTFSQSSVSTGSAVVLVIVRLSLSLWAWWLVPSRCRPLIMALVLFELGDALLLGIGRYHTGIPAAGSSRYQYSALCAFVPVAAVLVASVLRLLPNRLSLGVCLLATAITIVLSLPQWKATMQSWRTWRGEELRTALADPNFPPEQHLTRLPWMTNRRAHELVRRYNLN